MPCYVFLCAAFIHAKNDQFSLTNFNISVNVTDKFLKAVDVFEWFQLEFDGELWTIRLYDSVRDGRVLLHFPTSRSSI